MEEITADYMKQMIRGVFYMLLSTMLYTTQTTVVKWGSIIGYTASVIVIFRGIIQFILCFIEATMKIHKKDPNLNEDQQNKCWLNCDIYHIFTDLKKIGIVPKRTRIPIFNEYATRSTSNMHSGIYSSFQSTTSYSSLQSADISDNDLNQSVTASQHIQSTSEIKIDINQMDDNNQFITASNKQTIKVIDNRSIQNPKQKQQTIHSKLLTNEQKIINQRIKKAIPRKRYKNYRLLIWSAIILRGIFGGVGTLILFMASIILPIGDIQSLMALSAVFTPFLAFIFFKDKLTMLHGISLIGALIGVTLIVQPSFMFKNNSDSNDNDKHILTGYILAVIGAFIQSLIYICIQFARKVPVYVLTMSQSFWGIITGFAALLIPFINSDDTIGNVLWIDNAYNVGYILILGFVGYVFLGLLQLSGKYLSSGVIALLLNLAIVWGYIVQIVLFHETPTYITIIGAICMFASAAIVSAEKVHDAKKKSMSVIDRNTTTMAV